MGFDLIKGLVFKRMFSQKKKIVLGFKVLKMGADGFPKKTFKSVSVDSFFGDFGGNNEAEAGRFLIGKRDFKAKEGGMNSGFGV
jgi:hypothetical protein